MKKLLVVVLLSLFTLGCASAGKINSVNIGMTKQEAVVIMGEPNSTSAKGDIEYLNYKLSGGLFMRDDYYIRLKEGKVDAFGRAGDFGLGY
ncbi:MAG: hypothetical protein RBS57_07825 [Desulforhabdus sp.]|nr:hypothetical protein [Desulforhabdus sp.]